MNKSIKETHARLKLYLYQNLEKRFIISTGCNIVDNNLTWYPIFPSNMYIERLIRIFASVHTMCKYVYICACNNTMLMDTALFRQEWRLERGVVRSK